MWESLSAMVFPRETITTGTVNKTKKKNISEYLEVLKPRLDTLLCNLPLGSAVAVGLDAMTSTGPFQPLWFCEETETGDVNSKSITRERNSFLYWKLLIEWEFLAPYTVGIFLYLQFTWKLLGLQWHLMVVLLYFTGRSENQDLLKPLKPVTASEELLWYI